MRWPRGRDYDRINMSTKNLKAKIAEPQRGTFGPPLHSEPRTDDFAIVFVKAISYFDVSYGCEIAHRDVRN